MSTEVVEVEDDGGEQPLVQYAEPAPQAPARKVKPKPEGRPTGSVHSQMVREEQQTVAEWFQQLGADGAYKVQISRKTPTHGPNGENIGGALETIEELPDDMEDYLRERWGGGTFQLMVNTLNAAGSWKYLRAKQVKIGGEAKMHGRSLHDGATVAAAPAAPTRDPLAERAFNVMQENARRAEDRAERLQNERGHSSGIDPDVLRSITAPFAEQLKIAQETVADLQRQILTISTRPPPKDEFRDHMMERAFDGESQRVETLRLTWEARYEKMREEHQRELTRLREENDRTVRRIEERNEDEVKRIEARHERELASAEKAHGATDRGSQIAFDARIEALKDSKSALERELASAQAKIAVLEARKDQTIGDKAEEILKLRETLDGLGGGSDDETWYQKAISAVGQAPALISLVERVTGAGGGDPAAQQQQQVQQQQQMPPPGQPFRGPDGNVYMNVGNGQIALVPPAQLKRLAQRRARRQQELAPAQPQQAGDAAAAPPDASIAGIPKARRPKAKEVKLAVQFMENAVRGGASPQAFASSARSMIPTDILAFIQQVGIDNFLKAVGLEVGSPLATVNGRRFARDVMSILLTGEVEQPAPVVVASSPIAVVDAPAPEAGDAVGDVSAEDVAALYDDEPDPTGS